MLTGDQNIVDLAYSVRWNISDPALFRFQLKEPEETIREVGESEMRAVIGTVSLNDAIGSGRTGIETQVIFAEKGLEERIQAEGANSPADVILTVDVSRLDAAKDAGVALWQPDLVAMQAADRPIEVVRHPPVALAPRQPRDVSKSGSARCAFGVALERSQVLAEGRFALAAHDGVDARRWIRVRLGGQARVVTADDDARRRAQPADMADQPEGSAALEGHDRQPNDIRRMVGHESGDRGCNLGLREDQVGGGYAVVLVDVAGQRTECSVRQPNRDRGHVLEGVRHRQQQHVHDGSPRVSA